jgi:hypothetical protein
MGVSDPLLTWGLDNCIVRDFVNNIGINKVVCMLFLTFGNVHKVHR